MFFIPHYYAARHCSTLTDDATRCTALRCSTLLYAALRCSTLLYASLRWSKLLYATLRCSTLLYATIRCSTLLYAALRWDQKKLLIEQFNISFEFCFCSSHDREAFGYFWGLRQITVDCCPLSCRLRICDGVAFILGLFCWRKYHLRRTTTSLEKLPSFRYFLDSE
jgi:hypothetical protein